MSILVNELLETIKKERGAGKAELKEEMLVENCCGQPMRKVGVSRTKRYSHSPNFPRLQILPDEAVCLCCGAHHAL